MDIVFIEGLRAGAVIGIHDWERHVRQELVLNLELAANNRAAAATDAIADAVDYETISQRVIDFIESSHCQLIETLAEQVAALLLTEFNVSWLRLRLAKPAAVAAAVAVGVIIERGERP